jgi:hypothetical protein
MVEGLPNPVPFEYPQFFIRTLRGIARFRGLRVARSELRRENMSPAQIYALRIKLISMPSGPKRDALAKLLQNKTKNQKH